MLLHTCVWQTALGAGSAYVSTKAGKAERIELYKQWLENAQLIFAIPGKDLSVAQVSALRRSMPEGTKVRVRCLGPYHSG